MERESRQELLIQEELREISLDQIAVNPYQPRRHFDQMELEELAQSIRSVGLLHPPLVRPILGSETYELISGERRYRAARLAGLKTIFVVVHHQTITEISAQAALIENIQRVDLNPLDIARALQKLTMEFGFTQEQMGKQIGKKRSTIANYLRLLTLPLSIQDSLMVEAISMGHAKAILSLEGFEKQQLLHQIILRDGLTVREAENAALRIAEKVQKKSLKLAPIDFHLEQIAEKIQHKFGTKVTIQGKGDRGSILIDYYNLDDLDRVLELLGVQP